MLLKPFTHRRWSSSAASRYPSAPVTSTAAADSRSAKRRGGSGRIPTTSHGLLDGRRGPPSPYVVDGGQAHRGGHGGALGRRWPSRHSWRAQGPPDAVDFPQEKTDHQPEGGATGAPPIPPTPERGR